MRASEAAGGGFQFFPVLHRLESFTGSRMNFGLGGPCVLYVCVRVRMCVGVSVTVRLAVA